MVLNGEDYFASKKKKEKITQILELCKFDLEELGGAEESCSIVTDYTF